MDLSPLRVVRLLSRSGFNARFHSTGTLNSRQEVYSKPSWMTISPYTSGSMTGDMVKLDWCPPGVLVGRIHLRVSESHTASQCFLSGL